jgi:hypothetical protein
MSTEPYTFNTIQVRPANNPYPQNSMEISTPFHATSIPIGISTLNIDRNTNIRIKAFVSNATSECSKAAVHLDAWHDTILYSAGCTWLDICKHDRDFQYGKFSAVNLSQNHTHSSTYITFEKPYASVPKIVVWLQELDIDRRYNWRVKAYAENVTTTGFTLNILTWASTILYKATASWIAHSSTRSNITSGQFSTQEIRSWDKPQVINGTSIVFDKKFERPPRVLVALNSFDVDHNTNLGIKAHVRDITAEGMNLNIDSWDGTTLYSGRASYLAIQDY